MTNVSEALSVYRSGFPQNNELVMTFSPTPSNVTMELEDFRIFHITALVMLCSGTLTVPGYDATDLRLSGN